MQWAVLYAFLLFGDGFLQTPGVIRLTDPEGKSVSVQTTHRITVFVFLSPECPLCQNYTLTLNNLHEKFKAQSVSFYGIIPGNAYSKSAIKAFIRKYRIGFPVLKDEQKTLAGHLNASVTPEAFVLDGKAQVRYSGRIDNWAYEVSRKRKTITEHNLQDALQAMVDHRPVKVNHTKAIGCFIE